ncbi:MAG: four helix bundle protein [Ignavibacteriales bacterium]|nr:four helix bundle protein [Ignavibacteriales bacterium]
MNREILNRNKNINRGFRELEVWQEAVELYKIVKNKIRILKKLPYKVKAQIEDSIFSVSSNIAEGYCRRSLKENIQFINIALASLGENYSQIITLLNAGDIDSEWFDNFDKNHYSLENKLIRLNKAYVEKLQNKSEWKDDYIVRELVASYTVASTKGEEG